MFFYESLIGIAIIFIVVVMGAYALLSWYQD